VRRPSPSTLAALAAAAASAAAFFWLPLPDDDPFRSSLVLLPLVLAALRGIGAHAVERGGRRTGRRVRAAEGTVLLLLVAAALARPRLGLPFLAEVLAAGFVLLLAHRVGRLLLALRPCLGARLASPPPPVFFFLPLVVYLALLPWQSEHRGPDGDEPYYLLVTHSLAYDLDAELTDNYQRGDWRRFVDRPLVPQPGDPRGPRGELYSRHNLLLPLMLAPAYRVAGRAGALAVMAALTAALAWLTLALARHYCPRRPGPALAAWGLAAFTPPLLLYSYQVWVEVPAALLALAALDRLLALERRERLGEGAGWRDWAAVGLPVLLLPLLKMRFALLAAPLLALAWWRGGRPRRALVVLTALLAAVSAGTLVYNQLLYGNPLKIHSWQELELLRYAPRDWALGLAGFLWDGAFGLFACAPIWMIAVPALVWQAARRRPLLADLGVLAVPYLLVVAPRREWFGGWSPPFRYALFALPLLALALVPLLARRRRAGARALLAGLGALTLALTLVWIAVPGWTYNFADGRTYLLDHLGERWSADVARFFPSMVRPRAATWIWPLLSAPLLVLLWWWPRRRPRRAALWGLGALLALAAALPLAARRVPTAVVELEDAHVVKRGGHLFPERWVIERPRYRGGWVLRPGDSLAAPVVAGGGRVRVRLHLQFLRRRRGPLELELRAGERPLGAVRLRAPRVWESPELGPFEWPAGAPLVLAARAPAPGSRVNGVLLDRAELEWE
jgi:hypothetical protein